jgi:hypothetical protein
MAEFLVELYLSRLDTGAAERGAHDAHLAAEELTRQGTPVRYLHSIFVPEDETCLLLYEAGSADAVREAVLRAALPFERVTEAVATSNGTGHSIPGRDQSR